MLLVSGGDERWLNNMFALQPVKPTVGEWFRSPTAIARCRCMGHLERQRAVGTILRRGGGERNPLQSLYAGGNICPAHRG